MLLIGMLDSPFVRRVAISLRLLAIPFERADWSVGRDFERIRAYNPLVRVPTLVLEDGSVLAESAAILDTVDELAGPGRALMPPAGLARREVLQLMAAAVAAAEFARDLVYERALRPLEKQHAPWSQRRTRQLEGALALLEHRSREREGSEWLVGEHMTQADITLACCCSFVADTLPLPAQWPYPRLQARVARTEALPEFASTRTPFFVPTPPAAGDAP